MYSFVRMGKARSSQLSWQVRPMSAASIAKPYWKLAAGISLADLNDINEFLNVEAVPVDDPVKAICIACAYPRPV